MEIIADKIRAHQLKGMAIPLFGNMVKAVVDVERRVLAVDAELHSDLEAMLLEKGSLQKNLWGINLYTPRPKIAPERRADELWPLEYSAEWNPGPVAE